MSISRTIILAAIAIAASAAPALSNSPTQSVVAPAAAREPTANVTTGSINAEPTFEQRMQDCMAIWDKGTHMTKAQWRRSCRTTLQSLTD